MATPQLIGREREHFVLETAWQRARAGEGMTVLVGGPAGVGKSALVANLAEELKTRGGIVMSGTCHDDAIVPMQALIEAVNKFIDDAPTQLLTSYVEHCGGELARLAPRLAERVAANPPSESVDPDTGRLRIVAALWGLVRMAADRSPVLIVVEDLHCATELTRFAFRYVLRNLVSRRVLLLATYRDDEMNVGAMFAGEPHVERLIVTPLTTNDVKRLTAKHLGCSDEAAESVAASMYEQAGGNPLFTLHLLDYLIETGQLRDTTGRWRLAARPAPGTPQVVQNLIAARLDRLPGTTQTLLSYAAVIGDPFELPVLEAIPEVGASALDDIERAIAARMVEEDEAIREGFRFTHAIARQAVVDMITPSRRAAIHARVGTAITAVHGSELDLRRLQLAHHFLEAHGFAARELAARCALEGARAAMRAFDYQRAHELAERGIERLESREPVLGVELLVTAATAANGQGKVLEARRLGLLAAEAAERLQAWTAMADAVRVISAHIGSTKFAKQLVALGRTVLANIGAMDPRREATTLAAIALASATGFLEEGDHVTASERAVHIALELDEPDLLQDVLGSRMLSLGCDDLAGQVELCRHLRTIAERDNDIRAQAQAWRWSIGPLLATGDKNGAVEAAAYVERFGEEMGGGVWRTIPKTFRLTFAMLHGEFDAAASECAELGPAIEQILGGVAQRFWLRAEQGRLAEQLRGLRERYERTRHPVALVELAYAEAVAGERDRAIALLREIAADQFKVLDVRIWTDFNLALLTEACIGANAVDPLPALRARWESSQAALVVGYHGSACLGAVDRFKAILAAMEGSGREADFLFERALQLEVRLESPPLQARTRYWWAWTLKGTGDEFDGARADVLLAACIDTARQIGMPQLTRDAETLRDSRQ